MKTCFISTMNQKLYREYGLNFINEFIEYANQDINLIILFEGEIPSDLKITSHKNLLIKELKHLKHEKFINYYKNLYEANGVKVKLVPQANGEKKIELISDYRFNAIKFSFKPFAIHQAFLEFGDHYDYLIWTDADLRCKKEFSYTDLQPFLPNDGQYLSILQRENNHSECGFLGFNLNKSLTTKFMNRVIEIYTTGEIFSLKGWTDCHVFDSVIEEFGLESLKIRNISGEGFKSDHPFIHSGLENFFDHLKGPVRKKKGTSF